MRAVWTDASPPPSISLYYNELSFSWRRHCLYPVPPPELDGRDWLEPDCPEATLLESGTTCGGKLDKNPAICKYTCRAAKGAEIYLPSRVRFDRVRTNGNGRPGDDRMVLDTWQDRLSFSNQELSSYLPPDQRLLEVVPAHPDEWQDVPGDEIDYIAITSPRASIHRVQLKGDGSSRIGVPGLSCKERLHYSIHGDRAYVDNTAAVNQGWLVLGTPRVSRLKIGWLLGVGFIPRRDTDVQGILGGFVAMSPGGRGEFLRRIGADLEVAYQLMKRDYRPVSGSPDASVYYNNFNLQAAGNYAVNSSVRIGGAAGLSWGHSVFNRDARWVGLWDFMWNLGVFARVRVPGARDTWFELLLSNRFMPDEYEFAAEQFHGYPREYKRTSNVLLSLDLRLRFVL